MEKDKNQIFKLCLNLTSDLKHQGGVYKIYHIYDKSKIYIGSTCEGKYKGFF